MRTQIFGFNENNISFCMNEGENINVMVNATEMAKLFDRNVKDFMRNEDTKKFIAACLNKDNSPFLGIKSENDLFISRQNSGTWMHRVLALKFAAWLNPTFELWVYSTIETILFGKYVEREQSLERTLSLQKEMNELKDKPKEDKTGEDFDRYIEIGNLLSKEKTIRKNLTTASISEITTKIVIPH